MSELNTECPICLEDLKIKDSATLECGHEFHLCCIKELWNPRCPMCRADLKCESLSEEDMGKIRDRFIIDNDDEYIPLISSWEYSSIEEFDDTLRSDDVVYMNYSQSELTRRLEIYREREATIRRSANAMLDIHRQSIANLLRDPMDSNYQDCYLDSRERLRVTLEKHQNEFESLQEYSRSRPSGVIFCDKCANTHEEGDDEMCNFLAEKIKPYVDDMDLNEFSLELFDTRDTALYNIRRRYKIPGCLDCNIRMLNMDSSVCERCRERHIEDTSEGCTLYGCAIHAGPWPKLPWPYNDMNFDDMTFDDIF